MVEWVDSAFMQGWMPMEVISNHTTSPCISIGLLVSDKKDQITIVQSASVDKDQYGDGITIHKCCIKRMRTLRIKEE